MENKLNEKITSLNDLRALLAMLVVMSHINCTSEFLGTRRGAYAVSIFYMLSSFLCMYTTNTDINFKEKLVYVSRKIIKLIPLYYIFTLFTFLIVLIKPSLFNTTTASAEHLVKSLLFIPYQNENGIVRPILDVTWFLVLVFWFYIVFGISRIISNKNRGIICIGLLGIFFTVGSIFFNKNPLFLQYKSGVVSLILGIVVYYIYNCLKHNFPKEEKKKSWGINLFLYALMIAFVYPYSLLHNNFKYFVELIPLVILLIYVLLSKKAVEFKLIKIIAASSYSLYLCHEFVVKGFSRLIYNLDDLTIATFILSFICLAISVMLSITINRFIEQPLNNALSKRLFIQGEK